ncbi:MAG: hypothetical protein PHR35_13015 [Kiritimatiellae bacterium]|nr:hypothetical protein [Kiritimatiellia bacterium]
MKQTLFYLFLFAVAIPLGYSETNRPCPGSQGAAASHLVSASAISNLLASVEVIGVDDVIRMPAGVHKEPLGAVFYRLRCAALSEDSRIEGVRFFLDCSAGRECMQTSEFTPSNMVRTAMFNMKLNRALDWACDLYGLVWEVNGGSVLVRVPPDWARAEAARVIRE